MGKDELKKEREAVIDSVLIFMNDEIERHGALIAHIEFSFEAESEDTVAIIKETGISYESIREALNVCIARNYVTHRGLGTGKYGGLILTEEGQGRAVSVEAAKHTVPVAGVEGSRVQIGQIHNYGNAQIGDRNVQNVQNVLNSILESIEGADASDEEKAEVKGLFKRFLEHPLTQTVISSATTVIATKIGVS